MKDINALGHIVLLEMHATLTMLMCLDVGILSHEVSNDDHL